MTSLPDSKNVVLWAVRISWPLLGGVWGAMTGYSGYGSLTPNADSFGMFFAQGFFMTAAIIGLAAGILCGVVVGGVTEKLLRYFGIHAVSAVCVATLVNALVIWQLVGIVRTKYPGFHPPASKPHVTTSPKGSSSSTTRPENPCAQPPPPENSKERASWDAECR